MRSVIVEQGDRRSTELEQELSAIERRAVVEAHRLRSVEYVTTAGMHAVSNISALESTLASSVPSAAYRLRAVGDLATRAVASEIAALLR